MPRRRLPLVLLALGLPALLAIRCPNGPGPIRFHAPGAGQLVDDPVMGVVAEVADTVDPATVEVLVDGVDLVAALGLTPPILGASGVVSIGGAAVTVSGFVFDPAPSGPSGIDVDLAGLPPGLHQLQIRGTLTSGSPASGGRQVTVVEPFVQALRPATAAAGVPTAGSGDSVLRYGRVGEPGAASPVSNATGALRAGFVHAAESRIRGAP